MNTLRLSVQMQRRRHLSAWRPPTYESILWVTHPNFEAPKENKIRKRSKCLAPDAAISVYVSEYFLPEHAFQIKEYWQHTAKRH
jgi:hypothetical protein